MPPMIFHQESGLVLRTLHFWRTESPVACSPTASQVQNDTNSSDTLPAGIAHSFLGRVSQNVSFALLHIVS